MSLLTPDLGLLFWMVLSFLIVFVLLARFGFPVITGAVKKRQDYIEASLTAADEANSKLAGIQSEGESILSAAKAQQQDILAGAITEKQKIITSAKLQAKDEARKIAEESARNIEIARQNALRDVRNEVAELAVGIAESILKENLKDDDKQQVVISKMLDNI